MYMPNVRVPREGWHLATIGTLASGIIAIAGTVFAIVELVKTVNGVDPALGPAPVPVPVRPINIGFARVGVIDRGHPLPDLPIRAGQALLVGRDVAASVRLSDPRASRRHVEIMLDGNGWVVRDLGSVNPTRILSPYGEQEVAGTVRRVSHGQLAIGNSIITLYPPGS